MKTNTKTGREVKILGVKYSIVISNENQDPKFKSMAGYCDNTTKVCAVDDFSAGETTFPKGNLELQMKKNLRHEIVHAFLYESGLAENSDWALNEEIVDWIAHQGLKLYKAWQEAGAIE